MATDVMQPPRLARNGQPAEKPVAVGGSMVSIVIPCCGMLEYTELCVASIIKHTRAPYELIFLDVGSLDGTADYLRGLAMGLQQIRIEVVRTPTDLGIAKACRDALDKCRGEYIVLLNNDTIVTKNWVNQLISLLLTSPALGAVGPMSNYAEPAQKVESVPYRSGPRRFRSDDGPRPLVDVEAVQSFADEQREKEKGKCTNVEQLGGFCIMLKREVYKKLDQQGDLNKWTNLSLFDTDIVSQIARQHGYKLAVCRDVFIHHFGTRTFAHGAPVTQTADGSAAQGVSV